MIKLKEGDTYVVALETGEIGGTGSGLYQRDTRWLSVWRWDLGAASRLASQSSGDELFQYFAHVNSHKAQIIGIERQLRVLGDGVNDHLLITNTSLDDQTLTIRLDQEADFRDVFMIWAQKDLDPATPIVEVQTPSTRTFTRRASDGVVSTLEIAFTPPVQDGAWTLELAPGESREIRVTAHISHSGLPIEDTANRVSLPDKADFLARNALALQSPDWQTAYDQAVKDLRTLLLPTRFGPYPAAGLPNFVNFFGRDALITSMMIGPQNADISRSILRFLAHHQGTQIDPFREEEPGKILHEIRRGELSRTNIVPFGRYYGSVDSTALFIMALGHYVQETGDTALAVELQDNWTKALAWLVNCQTAEGLIRFKPSGSGLTVQSWKDSHDSMNHADGSPAAAPLAVAEVQGYAYAAFIAASDLFSLAGDSENAGVYKERAGRLRDNFHTLFWLPDLNTYAMALDAEDRPLLVHSSDPGHLLWCGIVPDDIAPILVASLFQPECWTGWGLRTLGSGEKRYNPVSYHNGSVWPHDTALFGAGLARYGFKDEVQLVAQSLVSLALNMPGNSLPELVAGFARTPNKPPIAYTHACAPQSWAAAGLIMMTRLASGL
ncbi:MAG TPA: amylo-alpha-1,6-glucosidase [Hyphomonadaceae bacterium]|nr:hypothetical protein AEM38_11880 [Hyphomonadaceae bacterium UKL13-1]HCP63051.1 amylo-alpha-1,6-glucosidase [Hyphomonadaceae bacterium]